MAAAAAVAGTAMADVAHMRRHGHESFHHNRAYQPEAPAEGDENCECITKVITVTGPPTRKSPRWMSDESNGIGTNRHAQ